MLCCDAFCLTQPRHRDSLHQPAVILCRLLAPMAGLWLLSACSLAVLAATLSTRRVDALWARPQPHRQLHRFEGAVRHLAPRSRKSARSSSVVADLEMVACPPTASFNCTGCGDCCRVDGDVWLDGAEGVALAKELGLSRAEMAERYIDFSIDVGSPDGDWQRLRKRPDATAEMATDDDVAVCSDVAIDFAGAFLPDANMA